MRRLFYGLLFCVAMPAAAYGQAPTETIEYYGQDAIGSIRIVFRPDGSIVGRQDYTPFGGALFPVPTMPKESFSAQEKDEEADQAYFHARTMHSGRGRFSQPDPVQKGLLNPQGWNRYSFALNRPVDLVDPSGLWPIPRCPSEGCDGAPPPWLDLPPTGDDACALPTVAGGAGCGKPPGDGPGEPPAGDPPNPPDPPDSPDPPDPPRPPPTPTPTPTPCPQAPPTVSLRANVAVARTVGFALDATGPMAVLGGALKLAGTYFAFRNHGPMDYKNKYGSSPASQNFGNFNYGAVTNALGISADVSLRAAGWGQRRAGTSLPRWGSPFGSSPYGDDPQDQAMISLGIQYAQGAVTCGK